MIAEALRGTRVFGVTLLVLASVTGCGWKVSPAPSDSDTDNSGAKIVVAALPNRLEVACDPDAGGKLGPLGPYACGETFATEWWGECNDCNDRGCTMAEDDIVHCRCFGIVTYCFPNGASDAGPDPVCFDSGAQCECDEKPGIAFECGCEVGVSSPQECACREPRDYTFDYEFECEK